MVAIGDHTSFRSPHHSIHGQRQPRADRHHSAPERVLISGFDDEMSVVAEKRIVHEAELRAVAATGKSSFQGADDRFRS